MDVARKVVILARKHLHTCLLSVCTQPHAGMDVARKVVILARTCGLDVTLDTLKVDSLVPAPLAKADVTVEQYMTQLPQVCVCVCLCVSVT